MCCSRLSFLLDILIIISQLVELIITVFEVLQKHKLLVNVVCVYFNQEQLLAERRADIEEVTEEMKQLSSAAMEEMLESLRQEQAGDCFIQLFSRVRVFCDRCKLVGPILLYCEMFLRCETMER